ncbi:MAG: hypothetical protein R3E01_29870 [Pirellulaceae bacterium]|nr:hypothetical protein [Planctomycetales bacterium]
MNDKPQLLRRVLQAISWIALVGTVGPSLMYLADLISLGQSQLYLLIATIAWFVATPFWMGRDPQPKSTA